jgi:hypothetical protein
MTPEEKFMFDLEGYFIIRNVLTTDEVAELNALADEKLSAESRDGMRRTRSLCHWGAPFRKLIDHPKVVPYLLDLMGPKFRLDHDYCIFMEKGATGGGLHGGETDSEADHWYRYKDGVMRNGLSVLTFALAPAGAGDGGFACIPGSHKSNFPRVIPPEVRRFERRPHYVVQPEVEAGDALFFTESLIHGTMPWTADHERRAVLYKYSPGNSAWSDRYYNLDDFEELTEQQKRILAPPSVGGRKAVVEA